MSGNLGSAAIATAAVLVGLLSAAGLVAAAGSGYSQSYTRAVNSSLPADVDLVSVSSSYSSGPNITASFSVAGAVVTDNENFSYYFWFDGSSSNNATAAVAIGDRPTASVDTYSGGTFHPQPPIAYHVSGGTLSISVATSIVGLANDFAINVVASDYIPAGPSTTNWLGTNYSATGGSGSGAGTGNSSTPFPIGEILWPVILVVVVIVVVALLVRRRRRPSASVQAPPPTPPSPVGAMNPPDQPGPPPS
jgi:hypothetical protein